MKKRKIKYGALVEMLTLDHATIDNGEWITKDDEIPLAPVMKVVGYFIRETKDYYVLAGWHGVAGKGATDYSTLLYVIKTPSLKISVRR